MFEKAVCQGWYFVSLGPLHMINAGNFPEETSACGTIGTLFVCLKFYYLWSKVNVSGMKNLCAKTTGMGTKNHTQYYSFFVCFFCLLRHCDSG